MCGFSCTALWHVTTIFAKSRNRVSRNNVTMTWNMNNHRDMRCNLSTNVHNFDIACLVPEVMAKWETVTMNCHNTFFKGWAKFEIFILNRIKSYVQKPATLMYLPRVFSVPKIPHRSWWIVTPRFRPVSIDPSVVEVSVGSPNGQVYQKIKLQ